MKVEKLEFVVIEVKNVDEAAKRFSDIFGTTFVPAFTNIEEQWKREGKPEKPDKPYWVHTLTEHADHAFESELKIRIDKKGTMELVESVPPSGREGLRAVLFKVPNIEEAKAELEQKGIRLVAEAKCGNVKEAIFHSDDLYGVRLCLIEHDASTAADAILHP